MSLVAVKKPYLLKISLDEDAPNPREADDNLGNMVCWHRHYRLGDAHSYEDPGDFLQELVEKNVSDAELIRQAKAGKIPGVRLGYVRRERIWTVESYDTISRKWIRLYGFDGPFSRCSSEVAEAVRSEMDNHALLKLAGQKCCILPVYLFDHSGLHISTQDLTKWPDGRWDAGQVGWVYADRKAILAAYGKCGPEEIKRAEKALTSEVELYDKYLSGECYGFQLYKDGEEMDSCWGFLGDFEEVRKDISEYLPEECWSLMDYLTEAPDMRRMEIEDYEELLEEMEV